MKDPKPWWYKWNKELRIVCAVISVAAFLYFSTVGALGIESGITFFIVSISISAPVFAVFWLFHWLLGRSKQRYEKVRS